jgi:DNA primase catalytic subunit
MDSYYLPAGLRYASIDERREFYLKEFNEINAAKWFEKGLRGVKFAVIIGRHTKIYPLKYKEDAETTIIIDEYKDIHDVDTQILEFLPEAVYYDRNIYDENDQSIGQELAFDLDPENITCPIHGTLADKLERGQVLSFCEIEVDIAKKEAIGLFEYLEKQFYEIKAVYSGRGFHLHVFDAEACTMSFHERLKLAKQVKEAGYHIDEWVTSGESRLIRLPYSLNGLVSRVVLPLKKNEIASFDAIHDERCLPRFLMKRVTF